MGERFPQLAIRVKPEFRDEIAEYAARHFAGNESELFRVGARLVIDLRQKYGHRFETVVYDLLNDGGDEAAA